MRLSPRRVVLFALAAVLATVCTWAWARSDSPPVTQVATLRLETSRPGAYFQAGSVGLSTEASELETGHLEARHSRLVRLMRALGRSVLRIAGGSVDDSWWTSDGEPAPSWAANTVTPADLGVLDRLLAATRWRALLGVDLGHFEPARAVSEARAARATLGDRLMGVEIGNEPNSYGHPKVALRPSAYGAREYVNELDAYRAALRASAPEVSLYGPDLTQSMTWMPELASVLREFDEVTLHFYATSTCPTSPGAIAAQTAELLSPQTRERENAFLEALAGVRTSTGRPTRLGETNSDSCTSPLASPRFASALWALDWTLRAASSGVSALNFHTRLHACSFLESPVCAPSEAAARSGLVVAQPEYYGLLAARQLEGGRFIPATLETSGPPADLTTWATLAPSGAVKVVLDNMASAGPAERVELPSAGYLATEQALSAPSLEARSGVELGGVGVGADGLWRSRPQRGLRSRMLSLSVRAASAMIVTLRPSRRRRGGGQG
jgi:hypothetical protein